MSKKYVIKHTKNRRNETNEEDNNVLIQLLVAQTDLSLLQQTQTNSCPYIFNSKLNCYLCQLRYPRKNNDPFIFAICFVGGSCFIYIKFIY
jgi:hypothetical protein